MRPGAPGPRQRDPAAPLCGLQGQLRQGLLPGTGLRRRPIHEAKLDPICNEIFKDIDCDTVDMVDNYDATMKEPVLLPTTFPNVLVSANQGIAVGMASNICSFNLKEVCDTTIALMKNPDHDILETLPGPDFSTGAELLFDEAATREIYSTGRGSFKLRAKWRYVKEGNLVEITEIPYSTATRGHHGQGGGAHQGGKDQGDRRHAGRDRPGRLEADHRL